MSLADVDRARWEADERIEQRLRERGQASPLDAIFVVEEPPRSKTERKGSDDRAALIEFLKSNPGQWVRYAASGVTDANPTRIAVLVRSGSGGFGPHFDATLRGKGSERQVYVRFNPPEES